MHFARQFCTVTILYVNSKHSWITHHHHFVRRHRSWRRHFRPSVLQGNHFVRQFKMQLEPSSSSPSLLVLGDMLQLESHNNSSKSLFLDCMPKTACDDKFCKYSQTHHGVTVFCRFQKVKLTQQNTPQSTCQYLINFQL